MTYSLLLRDPSWPYTRPGPVSQLAQGSTGSAHTIYVNDWQGACGTCRSQISLEKWITLRYNYPQIDYNRLQQITIVKIWKSNTFDVSKRVVDLCCDATCTSSTSKLCGSPKSCAANSNFAPRDVPIRGAGHRVATFWTLRNTWASGAELNKFTASTQIANNGQRNDSEKLQYYQLGSGEKKRQPKSSGLASVVVLSMSFASLQAASC